MNRITFPLLLMGSSLAAIAGWAAPVLPPLESNAAGSNSQKISDANLEDQWFHPGLSPGERNDLVALAKNRAFEKIAPMLIRAIVDHKLSGLNVPPGDAPWNADFAYSDKDRAYLMALAVWRYHTQPPSDPTTANTVLALLRKAAKQGEKEFLISTLMNGQWCAAAEQSLLGLCRNTQEPLEVRRRSAQALLIHCSVNTYVSLALDTVLAHEQGQARCQAFCDTLNGGNRLFDLTKKNRQIVLRTGFDILNSLPEKELYLGYGVGRRLGFILKFKGEFAPAMDKYLKGHNLPREFFADTVKKCAQMVLGEQVANPSRLAPHRGPSAPVPVRVTP